MKRLSIGKMAKLNNVSVQTLRLYDQLDLVKPVIINEETNYRYYSIKQSAQLDMIQYMKAMGMSLKQIKEFFDKKDFNALIALLEKRKDEIDKTIEELRIQKKSITSLVNSYNRYLSSPHDGTFTIEYIEERKIYMTSLDINIYEHDLEDFEMALNKVKADLIENSGDSYNLFNIGSTIKKDDFIKGNLISRDIFIVVDNENQNKLLQTLPSKMYACMYCDDFYKEKEYINKMKEHIKENKLVVDGDYICEIITDLPFTSSNEREMFVRLQVPVKFEK